MADSITDNRTLLIANEAADADLVDLSGSADTGGDNTEVFIEGSASRSFKVSKSVDGRMYDAGSNQDWSGNVFYIWAKCTSVTANLATGGVRVRFSDDGGGSDPSVNYFEYHVYGGNIGSVQGWEMIVIDIDEARANADGTNGTTPATTAIRYVGVVFDVPGSISGNTDNCFIDAMWRLPANTPGIIVQGKFLGVGPWAWSNIVDAADVADTTKAWGTCIQKNGVITINTPIRFGANDAEDHGFDDDNVIIAWQFALVPDDFYGVEIIAGASGSNTWTMGIKTGTGNDATGSQGLIMLAGGNNQLDTPARYYFTANDANNTAVELFGCQFFGASDFLFDDAAVSVISNLFSDCSSALISNAADFLRCIIVNANTADGVAFITTDDLADLRDCSFDFSDGHGIEYTGTATSQTLVRCIFNGYGADGTNDAAIYVSTGTAGTTTINVDNATTERSPTRTVIVVLAPVTFAVRVGDDITDADIQFSAVTIKAGATGPLPYQDSVTITRSGSVATVTHTAHGLATGQKIEIDGADQNEYNRIKTITFISANSYSFTVSGTPTTPATGTIIATGIIIDGETDVNGEISDTRSYASDQSYTGLIQQGTRIPIYAARPVSGTMDKDTGVSLNILLTKD